MGGHLERWVAAPPYPPLLTPPARQYGSEPAAVPDPCGQAANREPSPVGTILAKRFLATVQRYPVPSSRHFEGIING